MNKPFEKLKQVFKIIINFFSNKFFLLPKNLIMLK